MSMGYGIFCPVAKAAEVVAGRWTPLILTEMMKGSERFNDIQNGVPLMPRSLLARRLKEMELSGLITRVPQPRGRGHTYHLTEAGNALRGFINQLAEWGSTWRLPYMDGNDRNVTYLMWSLRQMLFNNADMPERCVIQFDFRNVPRRDHKLRTWWLIVRDGGIDLCYTDMGFDSDLVVTADLDVITRVVVGTASLREARLAGHIGFSDNASLAAKLIKALDLKEPPQIRLMRVPSSADLVVALPALTMNPKAQPVRTKIQAA